MIRNVLLKNMLFTLISLIPLAYLLMVWDTVPAVVPTHFNSSGPNAWGPKKELIWITLLLSGISIGTYFLLMNIRKIDPKRTAKPDAPVFNKMAVGMVFFLSALNLLSTYACVNSTFKMERLIIPLVGLMLAFIGNIMYSVKPNYFVGYKLPWTLSSDYNWRKTHQLGGVIFFAGGLLITVMSLFSLPEMTDIVLKAFIGVALIVPIGYSYLLFRKEQKQ